MRKPSECTLFEKMARTRGQKLGELINRSGWWLIRYRVDTPEGRERITKPLAPSKNEGAIGKREADRKRVEFMRRIDQWAVIPGSMWTFERFVEERFTPNIVEKLKKGGQEHYHNILKLYILPALGTMPLRDITPARAQQCINVVLKKGLSVQTATHVRNCLSAIMRHARAMQCYAGELPTDAVRLPEMKRQQRQALTWEQVCAIAGNLAEPYSTLVVFLTLTGLRIGEAAGLKWKWVNLTEQHRVVQGDVIPPLSVAVREQFTRGQWETLKTGSSVGNVPIPAWFAPWLERVRAASKWTGPEHPVFASSHGTPIDQQNIASRHLKQAAALAGLGTPAIPAIATGPVAGRRKGKPAKSWVSWHTFRHTNSTLANAGGLTLTERQRILRHASSRVTDLYTHADLDRVRPLLEDMVDPTRLN